MDNVIAVVALLRKHSELELQILNGRGAAVATPISLKNWVSLACWVLASAI